MDWARVIRGALIDVMHLEWCPAEFRELLGGDATGATAVVVVLQLLLAQLVPVAGVTKASHHSVLRGDETFHLDASKNRWAWSAVVASGSSQVGDFTPLRV